MIYDPRRFYTNILLACLALGLAALALLAPGLDKEVRIATVSAAVGLVLGIFRRSGIGGAPPADGEEPAAEQPEERRPPAAGGGGAGLALPVLCLAVLAFGACRVERIEPAVPCSWWASCGRYHEPQAITQSDGIEMKPKASAPSCSSGRACVYALAADGLFYTKEGSTTLPLHAARSWRTSADCSALSAPADGDVCYDTTLPGFRFYSGGWTTVPANDSLLLHKAGSETITGAKTFSVAPVINANPTGTFVIAKVNGGTGEDNSTGGTANTVWARPNGATGAASYRLLVAADIPNLDTGQLTTGQLAVARGGTGAATTSQNYVFAGPASGSGAPGFRALVAGDLPAGVSVAILGAGATNAIAGGQTNYLTSAGVAGTTTDIPIAQGNVTRAGTVQKLYCSTESAPGGGQTETFTIRRYNSGSWADTAVTCQVSGGTSPATCADTTHSQAVVAGDRLGISAAQSGASTAAGVTCTFELAF